MASKDDILAFMGYLEEAGKSATPGEWIAGTSSSGKKVERVVLSKATNAIIAMTEQTTKQSVADTKFIALCSPFNILKLIEEIRKFL